MRTVLVLGATSGIAQAIVRLLAARGASLYLVGRDAGKLAAVVADAAARGAARVEFEVLDLVETDGHPALVQRVIDGLGGLDGAVIAHGTNGDPAVSHHVWPAAEEVLRTNLLSHASLLTALAPHFERQRSGTLAVISSVAGDRGRASNYVYGASKSGLDTFLQGLRNRLAPAGVQVLTVKPGYVDTPMGESARGSRLMVSPEQVASDILRAVDRGQDVVYTPWFWRWIMLVVRIVPERLFKRTSL